MDRGFAPVGSPREAFWEDVLHPLARVSRTATVVDRYLLKDLLGDARRVGSEHVLWLLQHLEASLRANGLVTLIVERLNTETAQDVLHAIDDSWPRGRGRRTAIEVYGLEERAGKGQRPIPARPAHPIRRWRSCRGWAGFDRLRGPTIWDPDGMKWD